MRKQTQHQQEIEHKARGQRPRPLLSTPVLIDHSINQLDRKRPSQHTDRSPLRQATFHPCPRLKIHKEAGYQPAVTLSDWHWL